MRKFYYLLVALSLCQFSFGQLEPVSSVSVGGGGDFTNQPLSLQSNFSKSQTIYYPDQLKFVGEITQVTYFRAFSANSTSPTPNSNLIFKIGHTTKEEFSSGDNFISDSELTTISVSTYNSGTEWIFILDQPFQYNGIDNLVIDVEDINSYKSTSALDGFKGSENFGNPPTRSMMSFTNINEDETTSTYYSFENSFAKTKFTGNLERCIWVSVIDIENVTYQSADFTLLEEVDANHYRYAISENGEVIPEDYSVTTDTEFTVNGLLAAQNYSIHVKSDCDFFNNDTDYRTYGFNTRPITIQAPYSINFDEDLTRDYSIDDFGEISPEASNASTNGVLFYGRTYPGFLSWNDNGNPFEKNEGFIKELSLDVDLTTTTLTEPILKFDLNQTIGSYVRIKINDFANDYYSTGEVDDFIYQVTSNNSEFRTIRFDLTPYIGKSITVKLQHVSRSTGNKTYIDNVILQENDCSNEIANNIITTTIDSITLDWETTLTTGQELVFVEHDSSPGNDLIDLTTTNYTIDNLEVATPYNVYIRSSCDESNTSPWEKFYASTEPVPMEIPYDMDFRTTSFYNNKFSTLLDKYSKTAFSNGNTSYRLFQQSPVNAWVGGDITTEEQAWNENQKYKTGLNFLIDATGFENTTMQLGFMQEHYFSSLPTHSWFRILINGEQVGPSYNPTAYSSDPLTTLDFDLSNYDGTIISVVLEQVGRYSADLTKLYDLTINGDDASLGINEVDRESFNVYPNPTENILNINSKTGLNTITIFDVNGRKLNSKEIYNKPLKYQLDVSNLSNGIYFIELISDNFKQTKKIIKK